jgi:hypothetical protein
MPFLLGAAAIGLGGTIASSVIGANAAKKSSSQMSNAYQGAIDLGRQNLATTTGYLSPWITGGQNALSSYQKLLGIGTPGGTPDYSAFTSSPGYQFQLGQGLDALKAASSAGTGATPGGNQMKALMGYGQGLAGTTFNNYLNQLFGLSNTGLSAASDLGRIGAGEVQGLQALMTGQGNARAGGTMGAANATAGGLNNAFEQYLMPTLMSPQFKGLFGSSAPTSQANPLASPMNLNLDPTTLQTMWGMASNQYVP